MWEGREGIEIAIEQTDVGERGGGMKTTIEQDHVGGGGEGTKKSPITTTMCFLGSGSQRA
jgi:hypothetical protein